MEQKAFSAVNYKANGDGARVRTGIAAVFGNVDSVGDITHAGSFQKTLGEGRKRFKHLWNHDSSRPPIASIIEIKEIGKSQLPAEILNYAPEATGGLWVKREYYDIPEANWVMAAIDAGDVTEMSFAYDVIKADDSEVEGKTVRNLRELALYDTSDVNYGANPATLAAGAKNLFRMQPLGAIIQHLQILEADAKAGRRNNGTDQVLIDHLHDIATNLGCNNCKPPESPKSDEAAAAFSTALIANQLKLNDLRLSQFITT